MSNGRWVNFGAGGIPQDADDMQLPTLESDPGWQELLRRTEGEEGSSTTPNSQPETAGLPTQGNNELPSGCL